MSVTTKKKTIVSFQVPPHLKNQMDNHAVPYAHKGGYSAIIRAALERYFAEEA